MTAGPKAELHRHPQMAREALLGKVDGLPEYGIRRAWCPGTNLLGLVKHVASVEAGYRDTVGRPFPERRLSRPA